MIVTTLQLKKLHVQLTGSLHGAIPDAFSAKGIDGSDIDPDWQLSFTAAQNAPLDPNFHGGPAIRYEFIYANRHPNDTTRNKIVK